MQPEAMVLPRAGGGSVMFLHSHLTIYECTESMGAQVIFVYFYSLTGFMNN